MLEEFTSREQQNSKQGLALFSLKIALEHRKKITKLIVWVLNSFDHSKYCTIEYNYIVT